MQAREVAQPMLEAGCEQTSADFGRVPVFPMPHQEVNFIANNTGLWKKRLGT
jgi:hypothetical protein